NGKAARRGPGQGARNERAVLPLNSPSETSSLSRGFETPLLEPAPYFAREQFNGVIFFMTERQALLSVLATHEALSDIGDEMFSKEDSLARFEAYRSKFEWLANEKFR